MDKFQMQAASELTSRKAGSIVGQTVKKMCPLAKDNIRRKYPDRCKTYQNCGIYSDHFDIKKGLPSQEVPFAVISQMQFYAG